MKLPSLLVALTLSTSVYAYEWIVKETTDQMTGETIGATARSKFSYPRGTIDKESSNKMSLVSFICESEKEFIAFSFSNFILDGGDLISSTIMKHSLRVKYDDKLSTQLFASSFPQNPSMAVLITDDGEFHIQNIMNSQSVLIEVNQFMNGKTYFEYSLEGSREAIQKARKICNSL